MKDILFNELHFLKEVEREMERIEKVTEKESKKALAKFHEERNKNIKNQQIKKTEELREIIEDAELHPDGYARVINAYLKGDIYGEDAEVIKIIEKGDFSFINSYSELDKVYREELYNCLEKNLNQMPMQWFEVFAKMISLDGKRILDEIHWSDEEKEELISGFHKMALAYFKGYIVKDNVRYYTVDGLPSLLKIFEKIEIENFFSLRLFEYPEGFTNKEQMQEVKEILKKWFNKNWEEKINLKKKIQNYVHGNQYKNGRRVLMKYGYLLDKEVFEKQKSVLLKMLYKQYQEILIKPDTLKKGHELNDIRNELLHYKE